MHRSGRTPNHLAADGVVAMAGLGLGATVASAMESVSARVLHTPGGLEVAVGRFTCLTGAYLLRVMVVLVARLPPLERLIGHPRLTKWHRRLSPWPLLLLTVHAAASMIGYAKLQRTGLWHEFGVALSRYEGMLGTIAAPGARIASSGSRTNHLSTPQRSRVTGSMLGNVRCGVQRTAG